MNLAPVEDRYEDYYAERLWSMVPAYHRDEDGRADPPGVLRAIVELVARRAADVRRDTDRVWEDAFVAWCDSWAVPYLADLVRTRLVSALNPRGRRVDVAKTIYYRRRKGTLRIVEELIADIAGWDGTAVEMFRRLLRAPHLLEPPPPAGRLTGTPAGGVPDLRRAHAAELAGGPFDELHHTPDVLRPAGVDGRHNIPVLALHVYRLAVNRVARVTPGPGPDPGSRTFDPSGRDVPLFAPRGRPSDWEQWHPAREWEVPAPIRCRLLGHAEYRLTAPIVADLEDAATVTAAQADDLRTIAGRRYPSDAHLRAALAALPTGGGLTAAAFRAIRGAALVDDCGKAVLTADAFAMEPTPGDPVEPVRIVSGDLETWTTGTADARVVVDPERGRMLFVGPAPAAGLTVSYHYGFGAPLGAGTHARPEPPAADGTVAGGGALAAADLHPGGVTRIDDSATYGPVDHLTGITDGTVVAADGERPYLRLTGEWVLEADAAGDAVLVLDGLWVGAAAAAGVVLRGEFERVTIRHSTLDPGGTAAAGGALPAVPLVVEGMVERLEIDHAIVAAVVERGAGHIEELRIADSIVDAQGGMALDLPATTVDLQRVTVLGDVDVLRLAASEALVTGTVDVTDTQHGCFRFSAAPPAPRIPRAYESVELTRTGGLLTSRVFGHPGYAQLSAAAPAAVVRGAENGGEIGAFNAVLVPVKLDGLHAKVAEYAPFGLHPVVVAET